MMPYKIAFVSLGCAKNLVNTEQMMALCRRAGHTVTGDPDGADVAVLNTCGFIESAKSEAIENILELAELKKAGRLKKLLVTGCLSQRYPDDIRTELPEVDGMLGTGSYTDVAAAVEELMAGEKAEHFGNIHRTFEDGERLVTTPPYTAYLKIAEGCSNGCAFCIIPKLRGRYRSRSMEALLAEARQLADSGVKELIVIAQDITRYGMDLEALPGTRRLDGRPQCVPAFFMPVQPALGGRACYDPGACHDGGAGSRHRRLCAGEVLHHRTGTDQRLHGIQPPHS